MSLFYNPKTRKPQPWAFALMLIVPILLIIIVFILGQQMTQQKTDKSRPKDSDIFAK